MTIKKIISPFFSGLLISILLCVFFCIYCFGAKSFFLDFSKINFWGASFIFFGIIFSLLYLTYHHSNNTKTFGISTKRDFSIKRTKKLLKINNSCIIIVFFIFLFYLLKTYGFIGMINYGLNGYISNSDKTIDKYPFHFVIVLVELQVILSSLLISNRKNRKYVFLSLFFSVFFSVIFMTRLLLLETVIFYGLAIVRKYFFTKKIKASALLILFVIVSMILVFFFSWTFYKRNYLVYGYKYTNNKFLWGFSQIGDYFLSTIIYSSNFAYFPLFNFSNFECVFPTLNRFLTITTSNISKNSFLLLFGVSFYNNLSGITSLSYAVGTIPAFFVIFSFLFLVKKLWADFCQDKLIGLVFYPLFFLIYIQLWRDFFLFSEDYEFLLLFLLISFLYIKKRKNSNPKKKVSIYYGIINNRNSNI